MKETYLFTKEELKLKYEGVDGITEEEADLRRKRYGNNELEAKEKKSIFKVFFDQFKDLLVIVLIIAALISAVANNIESTIVIIAVIVLNAILGAMQHIKAQKSLDSLKKLSSPKAKVIRDGVKKEILSREIVPGDLLILEAGDMVAADGRIIECFSLQVNESSLTGESLNVEKKDSEINKEVALAERYNMVYSGSLVTYGRAKVLVTAIGGDTEIGKIARLINNTKDRKTPLQISLDDFSKKLAIGIMIISIFVFALRIMQKESVLNSAMFAIALAVAAIPEALSSIVTIVQAIETRKMAAENAIIKDLKAVESLGCVSVICSDKTGTLTQNKMTVKNVYMDDMCIESEKIDLSNKTHRYLLYNAILNNDASIAEVDIGDPTETCLLEMVRETEITKDGINEEDIRNRMERLEEIPFDSDRKLMSTKYCIDGKMIIFTKGAIDVLLERIEFISIGNIIRKITYKDIEKINKQNIEFSENGLRVLAFVYKECADDEKLTVEAENGYTFLGLVSMIDPPREESKEAVYDAKCAGIRTIMITGDHKVTAVAIAKEIGIFEEGDKALTGLELDTMTDSELQDILEKISVYSRVSPENKIRIVNAWQKRGKVVAMTGDGVNDAPALKKADIGIAMGITGTEVSKDAAAMILADDNFKTIINAVQNGRNVYRNILNAIKFLISGNTAAILVVLFSSVMALDAPFEPVHLLFINLLTDSLPALAIGMEKSDKNLLREKPRNPRDSIVSKAFCFEIIGYGLLIAIATQIAFYVGLMSGPVMAKTMAFSTLTLARLLHGFNCRSTKSIYKIGYLSNLWSVGAFFAGIVFLIIVLFVPVFQKLFLVGKLNVIDLGIIVLLAIVPNLCIQGRRIIREIL